MLCPTIVDSIEEKNSGSGSSPAGSRPGTFASVTVLITEIRTFIDQWNADAKPFVWTATAGEIFAKVRLVQTNIKRLIDNNAK